MKISLSDVAGGYNINSINENFEKIETLINDSVLFRDNPEGEPNSLLSDIDVNGKILYNLPAPTLPSQAARLQDVRDAVSGVPTASFVPFAPYGSLSSTTVQGAIQELLDESSTPDYGAGSAIQAVSSIQALKGLDKTALSKRAYATGYYVQGDGGGGSYYYDATDTVSADNGSTVVVATDGGRWKLDTKVPLTARQMGAKGDDTTDDSIPLQKLVSGGYRGYTIPSGNFVFNTGLVVDYKLTPSFPIPGALSPRFDISGESFPNTILKYGGSGFAIKSYGSSSAGDSQGIHAIDIIRNLSLTNRTYSKTNDGLYMENRAFWRVSDLFIQYFNVAFELQSSFTGLVQNCFMNYNTIGMKLTTNALGAINAVKFDRCTFSGNSFAGVVGVAVGSSTSFDTCTIEGNGTMGVAGSGGFIGNIGAYGYSGPITFKSCYFEFNKGSADIYIDNVTNSPLVVNIEGCIFNRASSVNYTLNNITATSSGGGRITVILTGNSFISAGSYVPSPSRPFWNTGIDNPLVEFVDGGGNVFNETVSLAAPFAAGVVVSGKVNANGTVSVAHPSISVSKLGTGTYRVTSAIPFGKNTSFYNASAICNETSGTLFVRVVLPQTANSFDVVVANNSFVATDGAFAFTVSRLGG